MTTYQQKLHATSPVAAALQYPWTSQEDKLPASRTNFVAVCHITKQRSKTGNVRAEQRKSNSRCRKAVRVHQCMASTPSSSGRSPIGGANTVLPYRMHVSQRYLDLTRQKLELTRLPRDPQTRQQQWVRFLSLRPAALSLASSALIRSCLLTWHRTWASRKLNSSR